MDRRAVPVVGLRHADRRVPGPLPDAQGASGRAGRAAPIPAEAGRAHGQGGRDLGRHPGPAAHLQRLFRRRRRRGGGRLRELRRARRLRGARAAGHRREGQDRDRPLRRLVAGDQAEGGGPEGRHRLPHLLRPAGRRLLPGRRLPEGSLADGAGRPAWLRPGHAAVSGRSADAGGGRHRGREAHDGRGGPDDHEDPGAADLLRRRAADPGGDGRPGRARVVARRSPADVPPGPRAGPRAHEARLQLGPGDRPRRDRGHARRGAAGRVGRAWQPHRRLDVRCR